MDIVHLAGGLGDKLDILALAAHQLEVVENPVVVAAALERVYPGALAAYQGVDNHLGREIALHVLVHLLGEMAVPDKRVAAHYQPGYPVFSECSCWYLDSLCAVAGHSFAFPLVSELSSRAPSGFSAGST